MTPARHLVSVSNPAYAVDAMDAHVAVLVERARAHRRGEISEDEVHVWWGLVRSARRQDELPHLPDVRELASQAGERRCSGDNVCRPAPVPAPWTPMRGR